MHPWNLLAKAPRVRQGSRQLVWVSTVLQVHTSIHFYIVQHHKVLTRVYNNQTQPSSFGLCVYIVLLWFRWFKSVVCFRRYSLSLVVMLSFFCSIFLLHPTDQFYSQQLIYICECFSGAQGLRIVLSKRSNRLGASGLKTGTEPVSRNAVFCCLYICYTMDNVQKKKNVSVFLRSARFLINIM